MDPLEAFWLGIVQGLTEFLPVSSSGHLVLLQSLLGIEQEGLVFEVAVHVATLVATLIFYRKRVAELVVGAVSARPEAWRYAGKLAVGTLPAVCVGLFAKDFVDAQFSAPYVTGVGLLVTGAVLFSMRTTVARAPALAEPGWGAALLIGCAQAIAILPGISRSGSTVAAAVALGVKPLAAAEFSFLLGVIAIAGAASLILPEARGSSEAIFGAVVLGSAAALVSGVAAIALFVRLLRSQNFYAFAYYTWAAGALFLGWLLLEGA